ncbi:MAG: hypothetical protein ACRCYW_08940, partial [Aeromonas sp.]|uniref:hypothetical protein n=1 Tax=Aeromonas sp. TaxID=647 RepID=UPI003F2B76C6
NPTAHSIVEDVLERLRVNFSTPLASSDQGGEKPEASKILSGKFAVSLERIVQLVEVGVKVGHGRREEPIQDLSDEFRTLVGEGRGSLNQSGHRCVARDGLEDSLGHAPGDFNCNRVGNVGRGRLGDGHRFPSVGVAPSSTTHRELN